MQLLLTMSVFTAFLLEKHECGQTHDQVYFITPKTQMEVDVLRNITSQHKTVLWQPASPEHITANADVHLFIPGASVKNVLHQLSKYNIQHSVSLENAGELITMQTSRGPADPKIATSFYERYHSLDEIYDWINKTAQENPDMVQILLIGSSFEKQPLYVLKLFVQGSPAKKAMWMDCGIHAREWISPAFCLWFVQYSVSFYSKNSDITEILNTFDIYILPVMNPDGYKYTWTENRMWRKNRSFHAESGCSGTDLNRNFDANWSAKGSSGNPCDETYHGQFPESEAETAAVSDFLRSQKDVMKLYISIHSYSQMLLFPYSCSYKAARNHKELFETAQEAARKIKLHYKNNYKYGAGATTIYLAPGGSDDWAYDLGIDYSFTIELQDNGRYGFLLPPRLIPKACNEALTAVKIMAINSMKKSQ